MDAGRRCQQVVGWMLALVLLAGCGPPGGRPAAARLSMETYGVGEPVSFEIDDTVHLCEGDLLYGVVQVTEEGNRPVLLQHSCIGIEGTGVDRYCEDGQIKAVVVRECSDAVFCEDTRVKETLTWDQQEYVEIVEECAGETIRRDE